MEDKINTLRSFTYQSRCEAYARVGHRCIQIGHHILIFGGCNSQSQFGLPILRVNCETMLVQMIQTNNNIKIQGFSLFAYKNKIYLWGGSGPEELYNSLWCFTGEEFQNVLQSGFIPVARHFHATCFFSQRYLLIYGGMSNSEMYNDWHILDCHTMSWNSVFVASNIPYSLDTYLFWNGGRGFLITGESFDASSQTVVYNNKLFEFKFTDFHQRRIRIDPINVSNHAQLTKHRGSATVIQLNLQSPYLMLLGGECLSDKQKLSFYNDLWIFNLQTLQWTVSKLMLSVGFGFEAIVFQQRLYIIGGINAASRDLSTVIEVIDINANSIEAKICQCCREMYGLKQYAESNRRFSIKYEYEEKPKTFFSGRLVHKFARFIKNPFSAIGLLVDNSLNLSATFLNIQFKLFDNTEWKDSKNTLLDSRKQGKSMAEKIGESGLIMPYNYIKISDNSFGFTHDQILQGMYSFSIKTEKLTSDKKYEEQLQIRKEYGINLKIGALRLGKSCLFVTKTEDNYLFVCYFSCIEEYANNEFKIYSYFRTADNDLSSDINRSIIAKNVSNFLPGNYEEMEANINTTIYIFHLEQDMRKEVVDVDSVRIEYEHSSSPFFRDLKLYLQCLYLSPFIGRVIKLENEVIKYKQFGVLFKKDLAINKISKSFFSHIELYQSLTDTYPLQQIMIYHQNRLIYSIDTKQSGIFGVIEIPKGINVDICKTKIQKYAEEVQLTKFINHLTDSLKRRRASHLDRSSVNHVV